MWLTLLQAASYIVGSVAPLITIFIAFRALGSWKLTLQNQRIDECVNAAFDLLGAIDNFVKAKRRGNIPITNAAFDQFWSSHRNFERAFSIARRYHPELNQRFPFQISKYFFGSDQHHDIQEDQLKVIETSAIKQINHIIEKLLEVSTTTQAQRAGQQRWITRILKH